MPCEGNFPAAVVAGREQFLQEIQGWLGQITRVETAEFEIYSIEVIASAPLTVRLEIRYDLVACGNEERHEERVGSWRTEWSRDECADVESAQVGSWRRNSQRHRTGRRSLM